MGPLCQLASAGLALIFAIAMAATAHFYIHARAAKYSVNDAATLAVLELSHQKLRLALPRSL
jgi:hypothetical protein